MNYTAYKKNIEFARAVSDVMGGRVARELYDENCNVAKYGCKIAVDILSSTLL